MNTRRTRLVDRLSHVQIDCLRVSATVLFLLSLSVSALSQVIGDPGKVIGDPGRSTRQPTRTTKGRERAVISKKQDAAPTTGDLSVVALSNANLLVEPLNGGIALTGRVSADQKGFVFSGLKPGQKYRVAGSLDGYHDEEAFITIEANTTKNLVTLDFKPIFYPVDITTNVENGSLRYSAQGQSQVSVVDIRNKKAHLELRADSYTAAIDSSDFGYETLRQSFVVKGPTTLNLDLKRIALSEGTYAAEWSSTELKEWEMPSTWQATGNLLSVKGAGVGLPRATSLRFYKDFKVEATVKLKNAVAMSFALRAKDAKNYYLLQVTGEKSDEPYKLRLFVVKDGVARRVLAVPYARSLISGMSAGEYFVVSAKMIGFEITVRLEDTKTGAAHDLSKLTDPDQTYPVGAVGIAVVNDEDNVIERFVICAKSCLSN